MIFNTIILFMKAYKYNKSSVQHEKGYIIQCSHASFFKIYKWGQGELDYDSITPVKFLL